MFGHRVNHCRGTLMISKVSHELFEKIIILFWTIWWMIAFWTDVVGGLAHLCLVNANWAPDTNYPFLVSALKMYNAPGWLTAFFFIGILLWLSLSTITFCWASVGLTQNRKVWRRRAEIAFIVSLTFWFAFFIADQAVMKFDLEQNHMVQGALQLLSYIIICRSSNALSENVSKPSLL